MKIFNWMRRRFTDDKDAGRSVENNVKLQDDEINDINNDENDNYNKCLLNDHQINDQWGGGYLLSIGTFGFDSLKHYYNPNPQPKECPNHYSVLDKEIEVMKMEKENDEIQESYDDELRLGKREAESMNLPMVAICPPLINDHHFCDDQTAALIKITKMDGDDDDDDAINVDDDNIIITMMEKKERTTLADLFNAESAGMLTEEPLSPPLPPPHRLMNEEAKPLELMRKIEATHPAAGKEIKKKKLSSKSVKQISQPIQKLVKKMLKRKIHPDVEGRLKANNVSLQQTPCITSEVGA